ncbi:hypothetical protein [Jatrophihabitans sp.]|uniref:hypothetical protein n=1 Tax=Jatrophihabitans sp. TaxID=1932789 RepID=UPI0030C6643C
MEEVVSGRITPTWTLLLEELDELEELEDDDPPLGEELLLDLLPPELLHPVTTVAAVIPAAMRTTAPLRIGCHALRYRAIGPMNVVRANISHGDPRLGEKTPTRYQGVGETSAPRRQDPISPLPGES